MNAKKSGISIRFKTYTYGLYQGNILNTFKGLLMSSLMVTFLILEEISLT